MIEACVYLLNPTLPQVLVLFVCTFWIIPVYDGVRSTPPYSQICLVVCNRITTQDMLLRSASQVLVRTKVKVAKASVAKVVEPEMNMDTVASLSQEHKKRRKALTMAAAAKRKKTRSEEEQVNSASKMQATRAAKEKEQTFFGVQVGKTEYVCQSCHKSFKNHANLRIHNKRVLAGLNTRCVGTNLPIHMCCKSDQYNTPGWMWSDLVKAFPAIKDTLVWDPFLNDGVCVRLMRAAGMNKVKVQTGEDFFTVITKNPRHLIVSNPPFSIKRRIIQNLVDIKRPFILLLPIAMMFYEYFKPLLKLCKVVVPHKHCTFSHTATKKNITVPAAFFCYMCGPKALITYC